MKKVKEDQPVKKNLSRLFYRIINYLGLCLPKITDVETKYEIPKQIKEFYNHIKNNGDIEIIYENSGSLFGYSSVNVSENIVNIVCFEVNQEFKDKAIFIIQNLAMVMRFEGYDQNVSFRCFFLPNCCFYDGEIKPEILNKYEENVCDASFYTNVDPDAFNFMYKGKLIRAYDRQILYRYADVTDDLYNIVLDLNKYKKCLLYDKMINSVRNITSLINSKSFLHDRKPIDPSNPKLEYSTKISTKSYIGYDKIYILIPDIPEKVKKEFISKTFKDLITDDNKVDVFNRFTFYEEIKGDNISDPKLMNLHRINCERKDDSIYYRPISFDEFKDRFLID